jgi:hypothetical protein
MTPLTGYGTLFIQIMTGDAKFMGSGFTPVGDLSRNFVMTLPALAVGKLLMFQMGKVQDLISHLQLDNRCAGIGSKRVNRDNHNKKQETYCFSHYRHTSIT